MLEPNEIFALLDSKINSGETEYLKIIHDSQPYAKLGFWYIETSMHGDKIEVDNPTNLCIYDLVFNYLLDKYGENEVDIIIPRGVLGERTGVEIFVKNLYVLCVPYGFSSKIYDWISKLNK